MPPVPRTRVPSRIIPIPVAVVACLLAVAADPTPAIAQPRPPDGGPPAVDQQIQNDRPSFFVRASVDRKHKTYAEGDELTLNVRCEVEAYLYVLYQQADGKTYQIFPNSGQPENRVKAGQDVRIPSADDGFRWVVAPPVGVEVVKVIASKKPVDALSLPGLKEDHFNPITREQVAGAGRQLGKDSPDAWAEHEVKIKTVGKGEPTEPADAGRRIGVFFGVSEYEFNDVSLEAQRELVAAGKIAGDKVRPINLGKCHRDAIDMATALKGAGRLDEVRVFTNREVTRDKMREMITGWLPSVSKPGDTVFLFFSGHGDQILDDTREEKDGFDETLDTTDMIDWLVFNRLLEKREKGELSPELVRRVDRLMDLSSPVFQQAMAAAGGESVPAAKVKAAEAVAAFLVRSTTVTDDEIGHWVQKLDGRRVVVILDACKSGGMAAPDATSTRAPARDVGFDFLRSEFARLKDLDQPSLTVLAAAGEAESSIELGREDNGMFTGALLRLLSRVPGTVDARMAIDTTKGEIADRIAEINKVRERSNVTLPDGKKLPPIKVFVPQLYTTDPRPVYLKPQAADPEPITP